MRRYYAQIENNIAKFKQKLNAGTSNPDNFITLSEIKEIWHTLNNPTNKTYSDMISVYLSDIDEKEVIQLKKTMQGVQEQVKNPQKNETENFNNRRGYTICP